MEVCLDSILCFCYIKITIQSEHNDFPRIVDSGLSGRLNVLNQKQFAIPLKSFMCVKKCKGEVDSEWGVRTRIFFFAEI